jgi:hypothetical protein
MNESSEPAGDAADRDVGRACKTPLVDLLAAIPSDARMIYDQSPTESQNIPVGRLAAEAREEIERLRAENEALRESLIIYICAPQTVPFHIEARARMVLALNALFSGERNESAGMSNEQKASATCNATTQETER